MGHLRSPMLPGRRLSRRSLWENNNAGLHDGRRRRNPSVMRRRNVLERRHGRESQWMMSLLDEQHVADTTTRGCGGTEWGFDGE